MLGSWSHLRSVAEGQRQALDCVGRGAVVALERAGIKVLVTQAQRVDEAVEALRSGAVRALSAGEACLGLGHHGESGGHCKH